MEVIKMYNEVLKISTKSNPNAIAGAIAGQIKEKGKSELQAIGAGATNQAVKAIAIARGFVAPLGINLVCVPGFIEISAENEEVTGIKFVVKVEK
ncbi:MAG: stage V sporulation protein S [Clostridia bacterium]|nr:stage V sporulation protein S [Clostridia bacterium]